MSGHAAPRSAPRALSELVPAALPSLLTFPEDSGLAADPEAAARSPLLEAATGASASPRSVHGASGSCRGTAAAAPAPPARGTTPRCGEPTRRLRARGGAGLCSQSRTKATVDQQAVPVRAEPHLASSALLRG